MPSSSAWFIMREAEQRQDKVLLKAALEILDANLERGWDPQYGGILDSLDIAGKPPEQLEWDQKLWWPHAEALYATLYSGLPHRRCQVPRMVREDSCLDLQPLPGPGIRRVVRVFAPGRFGAVAVEGQQLERLLPRAQGADVGARTARKDAGRGLSQR